MLPNSRRTRSASPVKRRRPFKMLAAALALGVFATVAIPAGAAVASPSWPAEASTIVAPATEPFVPAPGGSASRAREFMVNILGSVLKGATPQKWQREQLANASRYDHSAEALNVMYGYDSVGGWANTPPQTSAEYNMKRIQERTTGEYTRPDGTKVKTTSKPFRVPAVSPSGVGKVVGGGLNVLLGATTGWAVGTAGGKGISEAMGFDVNGGLCSPTFEDFGLIANLTGVDCDAFYELDPSYLVNVDSPKGYSSLQVCNPYLSAGQFHCQQLVATFDNVPGPSGRKSWVACIQVDTAPVTSNFGISGYQGASFFSQLLSVPKTGNVQGDMKACYGISNGYSSGVYEYDPIPLWTKAVLGYRNQANTAQKVTTPMIETPSDPERFIECAITGTDGKTYKASSAAYRESSGEVAPPQCPELPAGVAPLDYTMNEIGNGAPKELQKAEVTDEFTAWWNAYPECRTGGCKLELLIKATDKNSERSCFDAEALCVNWHSESNKDSVYQCRYGVHNVSLDECNVYAAVFDPSKVSVGAPYSDPETGAWSGGQSSPTAASQLMGSTVQDPDQIRQCLEKGWAVFNPVEWVMKPIQCAMEWAFVPRSTVVAATFHKSTTQWEKGLFGQMPALVNQYAAVPVFTGCEGIPVKVELSWPFNQPWGIDWQFGASCSAPFADVAATVRMIIGFMIIGGTIMLFTAYGGSTVGMIQFGRRS